jgi:hypothetical protein
VEALILLSPFLGGAVFVAIAWWLERATRRPGLFFLIVGLGGLIGAGVGLLSRGPLQPWLSLLIGAHAIGFLYFARWRQVASRTKPGGAAHD